MDRAIVDHRIYTIRPRCMAAFLDAFEQLAMPILRRHLGTPLGFYVSSIGPLNQVVHLWGYDSLEDFERRSAARDADPDFAAYLQATRELVVAQETRIIKPVHLRG